MAKTWFEKRHEKCMLDPEFAKAFNKEHNKMSKKQKNNTFQSLVEPSDFPKTLQKENVRKVVEAINNLKLKDIKYSRNFVFDSNGRVGDVFGLILKNAGLKDHFKRFRVKSSERYERGFGPRWTEAEEALAYVLGPIDDDWNVVDIQIMSDTHVSKRKIFKALQKFVAYLESLLA